MKKKKTLTYALPAEKTPLRQMFSRFRNTVFMETVVWNSNIVPNHGFTKSVHKRDLFVTMACKCRRGPHITVHSSPGSLLTGQQCKKKVASNNIVGMMDGNRWRRLCSSMNKAPAASKVSVNQGNSHITNL